MTKRKTETRALDAFSSINMRGVSKLFITQGKQQEVRIEGGEIAISRITTYVSDGKLTIDVGRDWVEKISVGFDFFSTNAIRIHITVEDLDELAVSGAADVKMGPFKTKDLSVKLMGASNMKLEEIQADTLRTEIPGAGRVTVAGKVSDQMMVLAGAGNFSGHKLKSNTAKITLSGIGSAQLWVTGELDVTIAGIGSVEYYGNPRIKQSVTMLGRVTSLGDPK